MNLTEAQFVYLYHYLAEAKLPPELDDLFKASNTLPVHDAGDALYVATPNSQYKWRKGQGKYRISLLVKNTPEFAAANPNLVTAENSRSPLIPMFHASFTSPHDVVDHMQKISSQKDLGHREGFEYLMFRDKTGEHNMAEDPDVARVDPKIEPDKPEKGLGEAVIGFLNDLQESLADDTRFAQPFPIRTPYSKLKKIAAAMGAATSAGIS